MSSKKRVFCSYSHRDEEMREELEKHLSMLKREGIIDIWHDRKIKAGSEFAKVIDEEINVSDIILLLVSPDFLHSDYCYGIEVKRAIEKHKQGKSKVIPVILRPCSWHTAPFGHLLATPRDGKAISTWLNRDEAFLDVEKTIRLAITNNPFESIPKEATPFEPKEASNFDPKKTNLLRKSPVGISITLGVASLSALWIYNHFPKEEEEIVYPVCRHPSHGIEQAAISTTWNVDSGWRSGGSNPVEFCDGRKAQYQRDNSNITGLNVTLVNSWERNERKAWNVKYLYGCSFLIEAPVIYKLASGPECKRK